MLCFLAIVMPWQLRNAGIERNQADPDLLAATLYNGSFPDMMYQGDPASYGFPYRYDPDKDLHGASVRAATAFISQQFRESPLQMSRWYLLGKPHLFLSWNIIAGMGDVFIYPVSASPYLHPGILRTMRWLVSWLHWPLTIAALCALVASIWHPGSIDGSSRRRAMRMLAAVLAIVLLMHMIGTPLPRYGIPFRPLVYILGMMMFHAVWQALRVAGSKGAKATRKGAG
jgi:hypothetical protein